MQKHYMSSSQIGCRNRSQLQSQYGCSPLWNCNFGMEEDSLGCLDERTRSVLITRGGISTMKIRSSLTPESATTKPYQQSKARSFSIHLLGQGGTPMREGILSATLQNRTP